MTNLRNFGRTKYLLHIGGIIALALSFSCGSGGGGKNGANASNANKDDGSKTPPIAITVGKSESREVASTIQATGSLIADETSDIAHGELTVRSTAANLPALAVTVAGFVLLIVFYIRRRKRRSHA